MNVVKRKKIQIKSNFASFFAFSEGWPDFLLFSEFVKYAF